MPATRSSVLNPQSSLKWYSIRARAPVAQGAKSAEILIYGDIGESWYGDSVLAKDFVQELMALDADEITVRINSFGGSVSDGIPIYNAIKRHKAATTVVIDGDAADEALAGIFVNSIVTAIPLAASFDRTTVAARVKSLPGSGGAINAAAA